MPLGFPKSQTNVTGSAAPRTTNTNTVASSTNYSTLTKFGVPTGNTGTQARDRNGVLMPKLKYRFRVIVFNFAGILGTGSSTAAIDFTQQVVSVSKPRISYEPVEMHVYNSRAYVAGKHQWEEVSLTLRDDITNTVNSLVSSQITRQHNHFEQTAYGAGINYKFDTIIDILDGGNSYYLERWFLEGCWLSNVNYGDLDYSTSDAQTIELSIRMDNCTQTDGLMPGQGQPDLESYESPGPLGRRA